MSRSYSNKLCQDFQNSLTYEKINEIWKHFRQAGNSLEGRISRANFKLAITQKFKITNEQFKDKLFQRFKLDIRTQRKDDRGNRNDRVERVDRDEIDLQDFVIGLVVVSLIPFLDKVRYIFYLTDLDEDGCLSLEEIENMIQRIQKIFWKENSSSKVESFSLLVENSFKRAQRNYKQLLFLLYKNNPSLRNDEGGLITSEQFIESLKGSKDLYGQQRFLPLNLNLAQVIVLIPITQQNVANQLIIRIAQQNKEQFCKFRKQLYTILQKGGNQKDIIKYPWITEIVKDDKVISLLPFEEKVVEKDKKQQRGGKARGPRIQFKQIFDHKSTDQSLESYQQKVKKMKETKEDPKFNIKFDKIVRK